MARQDILWKGLLEDVFDDFLSFLYPDVWEILDKDKGFIFLDKELEQVFSSTEDPLYPQEVDKLIQVFTLEGKEEWILVHVEVQDQYSPVFSERMYMYQYRIFDKYRKRITAFAIFTEGITRDRSNTYHTDFMGTSLDYVFNTYKIALQDDVKLLASKNVFALVVLTAKRSLSVKKIRDAEERDKHLLQIKIELAKLLLSRDIKKEKIRAIMDFLRHYVHFENHETSVIFEKELAGLTYKNTTMGLEELLLDLAEKKGIVKGREEGIAKGIEEGIEKGSSLKELEKNTEFTKKLLELTDLSIPKIASLVGVTEDFVRNIRNTLKDK